MNEISNKIHQTYAKICLKQLSYFIPENYNIEIHQILILYVECVPEDIPLYLIRKPKR